MKSRCIDYPPKCVWSKAFLCVRNPWKHSWWKESVKVFLLRGIRGWKTCTVCFGIDLSLLRNRISPSPDSLFVGFYLWCSCLGWLSQWCMDDSDEEEGASFVFVPVLQHARLSNSKKLYSLSFSLIYCPSPDIVQHCTSIIGNCVCYKRCVLNTGIEHQGTESLLEFEIAAAAT